MPRIGAIALAKGKRLALRQQEFSAELSPIAVAGTILTAGAEAAARHMPMVPLPAPSPRRSSPGGLISCPGPENR